jgi:hypothetical protein
MCIQFRTFRGIYIKHRTEKTKMYQPITLLLVTGFNNNGCNTNNDIIPAKLDK